MTREQAQVYAKLSKEDIAKIDCGYEKHYEVLCAFANGAEIQMEEGGWKWTDISEPYFYYSCEYRVKPTVETAEPWKPKKDEEFFFLDSDMSVISTIFTEFPLMKIFFLSATASARARKRKRLVNACAQHSKETTERNKK